MGSAGICARALSAPVAPEKRRCGLTNFRVAFTLLYVNEPCAEPSAKGLIPRRLHIGARERFRLHWACALCYIHGEKAKVSTKPKYA